MTHRRKLITYTVSQSVSHWRARPSISPASITLPTTIYYLQYYPRRNNQSSIIFLTLTLSGNVCLGSDIYFSLYLSFLPLFDTITILWTI